MKKRPVWVDYTMIIIGAFIMGFAIKNMYDPVNLVTGGVSGVAIIMKELARVPLWVTNTVLNIPLFLAAWKIKGWGFIKRTAVATVALSVSLYVIPEAHILMDDIFLAALLGGIISGYAGSSYSEKAAPVLHCPDHAGVRWDGGIGRCGGIWRPICSLCPDRYFLCIEDF